jgi:transcriptional regulator with XRE-family HTH domain
MDIQYIRELRIKYGIKAHEVAKAIGMDRGNYSAWENGLKEYKRKAPDYLMAAGKFIANRINDLALDRPTPELRWR